MNLEEFYGGDVRRGPSGEVDFGVMWTGPAPADARDWPRYRVSWIKATGEVYAVSQDREQSTVLVLGVVEGRELEEVLRGWTDHIGVGVDWVRDRLVAAGAGVPS